MKKFPLFLVFVAFALAGCQTAKQPGPAPVPPPPPAPVPQQPASPPVTSAGPLTKAAVETYMDAQEADLRQLLRGQGVMVARRADNLLITVPSDKLFQHQVLTAWGNAFVRGVSDIFKHYDHTKIEISGYTDTTGRDELNLMLSQKRAEALAAALKQSGVAASRMTAEGYGATKLKVPNGRDPRNRRIEVRIIPQPK